MKRNKNCFQFRYETRKAMNKLMNLLILFGFTLLLVSIQGCGYLPEEEGSGNSPIGEFGRSSMAVITADNISAWDNSTDYQKDITQNYVYEESAETLDMVNDILCQMGQSRPDLMFGAGNYTAQIDENKCSTESRGGDKKSGSGPKYSNWTMNSSRDNSTEPMIVKAWIPHDTYDEDSLKIDSEIQAKMKIYQPPSDTYPMGFFNMNFKAVYNTASGKSGQETMKGYMQTIKKGTANVIEFYNPLTINTGSGLYSTEFTVAAQINSDGSGSGTTKGPNFAPLYSGGSPTTDQFNFGYNTSYFHKQKIDNGVPGTAICLDRNNYYESAWRYGLYSDNGSRVDVESGFPIKATVSSTEYNGYIGYYGLFMDGGVTLNSGDTVKKLNFDNPSASGENYTFRTYPGKLNKHVRQTITLGDIKNIPMSWQNASDGYKEYRVFWDGSNLKADAYRDQTTQNKWADNSSFPQTVTLTGGANGNATYGFFFWSQALGGDGRIVLTYSNGQGLNPDSVTDNSTVIFHTREPVFPGDNVSSNLLCYERCPNPVNLDNGTEWGTPSVFFSDVNTDNKTTAELSKTYSFDNTTSGMVLKYTHDNGTTDNITFSTTNQAMPWGLFSGPLFDNTTANRQSLACDWDNNSICSWKARENLSTFFTWEIGPNAWQKMTVLESGGTPVKFDPPMTVSYIRDNTTSASGRNYNGVKFYLEYGGFGDLQGIPSLCVDKNGDNTSCSSSNVRYINEFVIAAGSNVNLVGGGSESLADNATFVVKPLEIEQSMKKVSASNCAGLSLSGLPVPTSVGWTDPSLGTRPTVTGPPSIIAGAKKGN